MQFLDLFFFQIASPLLTAANHLSLAFARAGSLLSQLLVDVVRPRVGVSLRSSRPVHLLVELLHRLRLYSLRPRPHGGQYFCLAIYYCNSSTTWESVVGESSARARWVNGVGLRKVHLTVMRKMGLEHFIDVHIPGNHAIPEVQLTWTKERKLSPKISLHDPQLLGHYVKLADQSTAGGAEFAHRQYAGELSYR